jgi:hypothetical protein
MFRIEVGENIQAAITSLRCRGPNPTDDFDRQENIRYDVYVNGVLSDILFGSSFISTVYGEFGENLIEVFATDTADNRSAPATVTLFL